MQLSEEPMYPPQQISMSDRISPHTELGAVLVTDSVDPHAEVCEVLVIGITRTQDIILNQLRAFL